MPEIPQHQKQTRREKHTALLIVSLSYPMIGTHGRERGREEKREGEGESEGEKEREGKREGKIETRGLELNWLDV